MPKNAGRLPVIKNEVFFLEQKKRLSSITTKNWGNGGNTKKVNTNNYDNYFEGVHKIPFVNAASYILFQTFLFKIRVQCG